jgi:hypothetical protein
VRVEPERYHVFCPSCKAEYKSGIRGCPDCDVDLVEELPPDPEPEEDA